MESKLSNLYDALFKQQSIFTINEKGTTDERLFPFVIFTR